MKKICLLAVLLLGGCSAGVHSPWVEMDTSFDLPFVTGGSRMPVVFPDQAGAGGREPMAEDFGGQWRSVEGEYAEYRFNP